MSFSENKHAKIFIKEYEIFGCEEPTEKNPQPQVFKARIFERNTVLARMRFFKILDKKYKIKSSKGVVLKCEDITEEFTGEVKNYGVRYTYRVRAGGLRNGYKEVRACSRSIAVQVFAIEMKRRYRVAYSEINIISLNALTEEELLRPISIELSSPDIEFPIFNRVPNTGSNMVKLETDLSK